MNPTGRIISSALVFPDAASAANPAVNTRSGLNTLNAGDEVTILAAPKVNGRTIYQIQRGAMIGFLLKHLVEVTRSKISREDGVEVLGRESGRKLVDAEQMIQFDAPVWVIGAIENLEGPDGPGEFLRVRFWATGDYPDEGYVPADSVIS